MRSRRTTVIVAVAVVSALTLGTGAAVPSTAGRSGGTLRVVLPAGSIPTLDPALAGGPAPIGWGSLWYATCANLMAFRDAPAPEGYTVRPEAAAGLPEVSRDGRTYVFTVRRGLRFSDGSRLTAANFVYAIRRVQNPVMNSRGAWLFSDVRRVVSASAHRLRIELSKRSGDLLTRLALGYACPVPLGFPVDPVGAQLMVGSGPYYIDRLESDRLSVLERNRYYRGDRPHRVDRVVLTLGGFDAALSAVEEGRADVLGGDVPFEWRDRLAQRYGVNRSQLFRLRGTVEYYLVLNTSRPLFRGNVALRKAVNLALDRTEIAKGSPGWPRSHGPTDQIVPRWLPGWVDHRIYPLTRPNLHRARRLASGNLRGGKAVLYVWQIAWLVDQANVIARQLRRIGLDVTVTPLAPAVIDARAGTPGAPYEMLLTTYAADYPDPAAVMIRRLAGENARKPAGNTNLAYFDNPRYNRRMAAANRLAGAARKRAFSELDREIMRKAAPLAPLYEGATWHFVSKRVGCVKIHPVFKLDAAAICLR